MTRSLKQTLNDLAAQNISIDQAAQKLQALANQPLGFATLDHQRHQRTGLPEVIFAAGKTPEQLVSIAQSLVARSDYALITRANADHAQALTQTFDTLTHDHRQQTFLIGAPPPQNATQPIPIITAGTSDAPVAEEAALTCAAMGQSTHSINDVGVAGLSRLIERLPEFQDASVIICIAGMEGALPSVVGGLVSCPVIAVPTSIGYGAAFEGVTALLGMMTSCAAGVTVVNIDNGFGAAYSATLIQRQSNISSPNQL